MIGHIIVVFLAIFMLLALIYIVVCCVTIFKALGTYYQEPIKFNTNAAFIKGMNNTDTMRLFFKTSNTCNRVNNDGDKILSQKYDKWEVNENKKRDVNQCDVCRVDRSR